MAKKIITALTVIMVLAIGACVLLLRPSTITEDKLRKSYDTRRDSFAAAADYLTKYEISAELDGLISADNDYGVPNKNADEYRKFNTALQDLMAKDCRKVVSDGKTVKFYYEDLGGLLNLQDGYIIYSKASVSGTPLEEKNWYIIMEKKKK